MTALVDHVTHIQSFNMEVRIQWLKYFIFNATYYSGIES